MSNRGGGPQLQNIPNRLRELFIPDTEEHEFTGGDLRQAEAMVVAWDAQDQFLINAFESGKDVHKIRACMVFRGWSRSDLPPQDMIDSITRVCPNCPPDQGDCTHSERYLTKRFGHAFAYKMGIRKLLRMLRQEGIFMSEPEANRIKARIVSPALARWQEEIAHRLKAGWLESPVGRRREFYGLYDEDMVRKALSWYAQHTIAHITNNAMVKLHKELPATSRIVTQTHDSLLICHLKTDRLDTKARMKIAFHQPISIKGRELVIPLDMGSGPNWRDIKK
jgi:DNA polymerase-1